MAKQYYQEKEWIIYHNDGEHGRAIEYCAVGPGASRANGTVLRGFHGTYLEVKQLVEDLNTKTGQELLKQRHYVRREKQK